MTRIIEPRTLPGFRDFLPEQMMIRKKVVAILTQIFEKYGFQPLETPTLEYQDILLGKYGDEAEKLMYLFKDQGQREVGMKYDLTVPLARIVAQYPNLPKPFKRYQIQNVWRADKPQKGRYREITQCDIDVIGTTSALADAEILAIIRECLSGVGFKSFTIRINSRQVLFKVMEQAKVPQEKTLSAIQSIDKLDKKSQEEVEKELSEKGLEEETISKIFANLKSAQPDENLKCILELAEKFEISTDFLRFDPTLARGLDYYTGAIFETIITEPKIGSITGGGRYDNLIGQFTGEPIAAVGTTLGLDRIVDIITELNLWPNTTKTNSQVLVTIFNPDLLDKSLEITRFLREKGVNSETFLEPGAKLDKQLKYADQKGIPFGIIIGPDEADKDLVTIKNLRTKVQTTTTPSDAVKLISEKD